MTDVESLLRPDVPPLAMQDMEYASRSAGPDTGPGQNQSQLHMDALQRLKVSHLHLVRFLSELQTKPPGCIYNMALALSLSLAQS